MPEEPKLVPSPKLSTDCACPGRDETGGGARDVLCWQ